MPSRLSASIHLLHEDSNRGKANGKVLSRREENFMRKLALRLFVMPFQVLAKFCYSNILFCYRDWQLLDGIAIGLIKELAMLRHTIVLMLLVNCSGKGARYEDR